MVSYGAIVDVSGDYASYEVITVDLRTKEVDEAADVLYSTALPGGVASSNRIVVFGGMRRHQVAEYCQVYSPKTNE